MIICDSKYKTNSLHYKLQILCFHISKTCDKFQDQKLSTFVKYMTFFLERFFKVKYAGIIKQFTHF